MKFPKLKQATLCQILIYLPAFSLFYAIFFNMLFAEWIGNFTIAIFIFGIVYPFWYLFRNFAALLLSDMVFSSIRCWKKARSCFVTDRNGRDRAAAEKKLCKRIARAGKACRAQRENYMPLALSYGRKRPVEICWFAVEKISMVYSVPYLDSNSYAAILHSAGEQAERLRQPKEKMSSFLMDRRQKKAPVATAAVVVILADCVDPMLTGKGIRGKMNENRYLLPCVGELSSGKYYFDSLKEFHSPGMTEKPVKNYAIDMVKKLVFGGKLPLRGNEQYLPFELKDLDMDMSLWEYIRKFRGFLKEGTREERRMAKQLSHGEVRIKGDGLYCKLGKRTACFVFLQEKGNPKKLEVLMDDHWCQPKRSKISKKNMQELKQRMETYLIVNGYRPAFVEENEENLNRIMEQYDEEDAESKW